MSTLRSKRRGGWEDGSSEQGFGDRGKAGKRLKKDESQKETESPKPAPEKITGCGV